MSSGFVTESELAEARQKRQQEWEKVRTAEQPLERPEEPYDGRSLFDRLKEQKMKKDLEFDEAHKLKNLIRGLDDDEVQFLEQVDERKMAAEQHQMQEDEKELKEFRQRVATLQEEHVDKIIQKEINITANVKSKTTNRPTQRDLLGVGIKRKQTTDNIDVAQEISTKQAKPTSISCGGMPPPLESNLECVAILPGIGFYTESSDSELSSGSDEEPLTSTRCHYDLVGRQLIQKKDCGGGGGGDC